MIFAAALALLSAPESGVETRTYDLWIGFIYEQKGTMTLKRTIAEDGNSIVLEQVETMTDKSVYTHRHTFDGAANLLRYDYLTEDGKKKSESFVQIKGADINWRYDNGDGYPQMSNFKKRGTPWTDPTRLWFVSTKPEIGSTVAYTLRSILFDEEFTAKYVGVETLTIKGKQVESNVVETRKKDFDVRIMSYLDDKGMPLRRLWFMRGQKDPYRTERLR